jgi:hypothetical protein
MVLESNGDGVRVCYHDVLDGRGTPEHIRSRMLESNSYGVRG